MDFAKVFKDYRSQPRNSSGQWVLPSSLTSLPSNGCVTVDHRKEESPRFVRSGTGIGMILFKGDPDQPRDENGRWTAVSQGSEGFAVEGTRTQDRGGKTIVVSTGIRPETFGTMAEAEAFATSLNNPNFHGGGKGKAQPWKKTPAGYITTTPGGKEVVLAQRGKEWVMIVDGKDHKLGPKATFDSAEKMIARLGLK